MKLGTSNESYQEYMSYVLNIFLVLSWYYPDCYDFVSD